MPAVVRGGRRQSSAPSPKRPAASKARGAAPRKGGGNASAIPAKMAAIGRLDLSPRAVMLSMAAGVGVLALVVLTGSGAERIGAGVAGGVNGVTTALGLKLEKVQIVGASPEARPAIQAALDLERGAPITGLDLAEVKARVEQVGFVKEARVVRLLPDQLRVEVVEHDRLAVWQVSGRLHVIDGQGQVIRAADARRYPRLPLVVGKGANEAAREILQLIAERPRLAARLDALIRVDERRWDLRLKDGALIMLPALDEEAALIQFDALDQRERVLDRGWPRIDLRTANETIVVRLPGEAPAAQA